MDGVLGRMKATVGGVERKMSNYYTSCKLNIILIVDDTVSLAKSESD